jgi:hypothetical protein
MRDSRRPASRDARMGMAMAAAGPVPPLAPLHLFGAEWHRGQGAKERMKSAATLSGAPCRAVPCLALPCLAVPRRAPCRAVPCRAVAAPPAAPSARQGAVL